MSVLWLIPSVVLAVASVVLTRGAVGAAREVRALHEAAAEIDVTLEGLSDAVARARTALVVGGAPPGSNPRAPRLP